ncbi:MAG: DNA-3-methyladenine glycosylase I [Acidimicrobiia bacterium]|jgi:DNA-3-methyladenine glycosylase I
MQATEVGTDGVIRCVWGNGSPEYAAYHDDEWGRPTCDDRRLFEKLCLEGFQSGLAWITILRKRDAFREVFDGFDIERVARFGEEDVARLLGDTRIVRHEGKIRSTVNNAQRSLDVIADVGSLGALVWSFEPAPAPPAMVATTRESVALAKELKRRGFTFVGSTTAYAFMQSMGLVNDHAEACAVREAVETDRSEFVRPS